MAATGMTLHEAGIAAVEEARSTGARVLVELSQRCRVHGLDDGAECKPDRREN